MSSILLLESFEEKAEVLPTAPTLGAMGLHECSAAPSSASTASKNSSIVRMRCPNSLRPCMSVLPTRSVKVKLSLTANCATGSTEVACADGFDDDGV